jgi:hypothetical protein
VGSEQPDLLAHRRAVEAAIAREGESLVRIVRLVEGCVQFGDWPTEALEVLRAALTEGDNAVEAAKARTLARHLFRSDPNPLDALPQSELAPDQRRQAERVRGDLVGLIRLGAGLGCTGRYSVES